MAHKQTLGPYSDFAEIDLTSAVYPFNLADSTHTPRSRGACSRIEVVTAGSGALAMKSDDDSTATFTGLAAGWSERVAVAQLLTGTTVSKIRVYWG